MTLTLLREGSSDRLEPLLPRHLKILGPDLAILTWQLVVGELGS